MHTLDNDPITLQDKVFAVGYGIGTVTELLTDERFRVQFVLSGRSNVFDKDGVMARSQMKCLFWHDPVVLTPAKDERFWVPIRSSIQALATNLRSIL